MKLEKFKELRVVVKNAINPQHNGKTYEVLFAELNSLGEPILYVEMPNSDMLLSLDLDQIDYVKVYDTWFTQYTHTIKKTSVNTLYGFGDNKKYLTKIGMFIIYRKEKDILSLVM